MTSRTISFAFATLTLLAACNPMADHRELVRMRLRVDSLARTVTSMNASRAGRSNMALATETLTVATAGVATLGDSSAPVTIVEFTDYQCPFCGRHATTTLPALIRGAIKDGKVRYIIRDLPIKEIHPWAQKAAVAARCARAQSQAGYWRYHDALFANQRALADSLLSILATEVRLDTARFEACRASGRFDEAIEVDVRDAIKLGLNATPSFIVGATRSDGKVVGSLIRGAQPLSQFEAAVAVAARK